MLREKTGEGKGKVPPPHFCTFSLLAGLLSASLLPSSLCRLSSIPAKGEGHGGRYNWQPRLKGWWWWGLQLKLVML